jgi:hypothetical protein
MIKRKRLPLLGVRRHDDALAKAKCRQSFVTFLIFCKNEIFESFALSSSSVHSVLSVVIKIHPNANIDKKEHNFPKLA